MNTFKTYLLETLLVEAREDAIAGTDTAPTKQGAAIFVAYQQKDSKRFPEKFHTPLELVRWMSTNTVPAYIQWVVNQYRINPMLFLGDFQELKKTLTKYDELKRQAGETVKKDINQYPTIVSLVSDISKFEDKPQTGSNMMLTIYNTMVEQVKKGNAEWYDQSPNISVYQPSNWAGSKAIRQAVGENNISLCVTYTNTDSHFESYVTHGDLFFVLTKKMMYSFYFKTDYPDLLDLYPSMDNDDYNDAHSDIESEFADIKNDHNKAAQFIRSNQPQLIEIFSQYIENNPENLLVFLTRAEAARLAANHPEIVFNYAIEVLNKERFKEAEHHLFKYPRIATQYAWMIMGKRWPEAEPYIMKDPVAAYKYAAQVMNQTRWPEAEPYIMKDPYVTSSYARYVIKGRWPEAEHILLSDECPSGPKHDYQMLIKEVSSRKNR